MAERSLYEVLGVSEDASSHEVRTAYKRLLRTVHPDVGGNAALFSYVQSAYEVIGDPEKRRLYDLSRTGPRATPPPSRPPPPRQAGPPQPQRPQSRRSRIPALVILAMIGALPIAAGVDAWRTDRYARSAAVDEVAPLSGNPGPTQAAVAPSAPPTPAEVATPAVVAPAVAAPAPAPEQADPNSDEAHRLAWVEVCREIYRGESLFGPHGEVSTQAGCIKAHRIAYGELGNCCTLEEHGRQAAVDYVFETYGSPICAESNRCAYSDDF